MAYHNGPKIVTDDLVMHLDASNSKSYKGEYTVNLEANPVTFSLWTSGATTTVTPAYARGPGIEGYETSLATRVVTTGYWGSIISSPANSTTYTWSIYLKSNTDATQNVTCLFEDNGGGGGSTTFTVTTSWQRFAIVGTTASATSIPRFSIRSGDLLAWGIQLEQRSYMSPFVVGTRGSSVATGGGFADLSGNSNHCTLTTTGISTVSTYGKGVACDGSSGYIELPSITNGINRSVDIVYRQINLNGGWGPLWRNDWRERIFTTSATIINAPGTYYGSSGIPDGTTNLQQFSYTIDGLTLRFYRNGVLSTTTTMNGYMNQGSFSYRFGYQCGGSTCTNVAVEIYSVKFYNRGLTASEILQNFNATKSKYGL
jgi:hypothetical protein